MTHRTKYTGMSFGIPVPMWTVSILMLAAGAALTYLGVDVLERAPWDWFTGLAGVGVFFLGLFLLCAALERRPYVQGRARRDHPRGWGLNQK